MSIEKKHSIYTAEDIKRYLSGGMGNAEMYAIEKAALDDPFLAEAIEGYEAMEQKDWSKELAVLKQKLEAVENAPVVPFHKSSFTKWWKAAAAVLVIGSSVAVAYFSTNKPLPKNEVVAKTESPTDSSVAIAKLDSSTTGATGNVSTIVIAQNNNLNTTASGTFMTVDSTKQILLADAAMNETRSDGFVYTPSTVTAGSDEKNVAAGRRENTDSRKAEADVVTVNQGTLYNTQPGELNAVNVDKGLSNQNNNAAEAYQFKKPAADNYFNAQVITPDNKPVAYANVAVPKSIKPVYTDAKGNFGFSAADSTVNVVVTSAGYTPQKFKLQNSATQNKIVLQPNDVVTNEVAIGKKRPVAKAEAKKEVASEDMDDEGDDAEPAGGWIEYNNYLSSNLIFPNEAKEKNIHGEVEVFVRLKSNGDISKVKVGKPLCTECDAEAIRLVKEGPKWEVKKNKASKVKVKIKF